MLAIYKKELKVYFTSVIACLFIAITLLIEGVFFVLYNLGQGTPYIIYAVSNAMLILVFTVPILTMRILADEQRQKTDQLIFTAPVSIGKVVVGKYLALCTIYIIPILVTCIYPLILKNFGTVPLKISYTEIFGMLLYGLAFIAIGVFISSITESQVIAAIVSIVILFAGYMMSNIAGAISAEGNIITEFLAWFDLFAPAQNFLNGIFDVTGLVYYLSIIVLFLFLTTQSIQKRKWTISKNTISTGVFNTAFVAIAIALAVVVNLAMSKVGESVSWASIDMTDQKLYTISEETKNMIKDIEDDIVIYVLCEKDASDVTVKETLERYKKESENITVEYKSTTMYPNFYADYTDTAPSLNSLIVVNKTNGKSKVLDYYELYETSTDYTTYQTTTTGYDAEGQLTSAITYVTSTDSPVIYQVTGHDEVGMGESFKDAIEKMNISIEEVNLLNYESITPDECEFILLLSPRKDYSKDEAKIITDYLAKGGKILMTTTYLETGMDNFNSIAEAYGIKIQNGYVAENSSSNYYQIPFYILADNGTGYASELSNYVMLGYAQGIQIDKKSDNYRDTITYTEMLKTTDKAVCKMNPNTAQVYEKEDGDIEGVFDLVVCAEESVTDEESGETKNSRLIVVGSDSVFSDDFDAMVSGANLDMFEKIITDCVETEGSVVSIPAKSTSYSTLTVTGSGYRIVGIVVAIILPMAIMVAGVVVWMRRRRK